MILICFFFTFIFYFVSLLFSNVILPDLLFIYLCDVILRICRIEALLCSTIRHFLFFEPFSVSQPMLIAKFTNTQSSEAILSYIVGLYSVLT